MMLMLLPSPQRSEFCMILTQSKPASNCLLFFFFVVLCYVEVHFHLFWVIDKSLWLCNLHIYLIGARQLRLTRVEGQPCNFKLVSHSSNEQKNNMHAFTHCVHKLELGSLIRRADICLIKIKLTANEHEEKHQWMRSRIVSVRVFVSVHGVTCIGFAWNPRWTAILIRR